MKVIEIIIVSFSDMDAFEAEIARERERREELESELDQMRKRLRESLTLIEHYQSIDSTSFTVRAIHCELYRALWSLPYCRVTL